MRIRKKYDVLFEGEKQCTKCGQCKPMTMFSPDRGQQTGRHRYCKTCRSALQVVAHRRVERRKKAPDRAEIWPRPAGELALDGLTSNWRYPVERGQLRWAA